MQPMVLQLQTLWTAAGVIVAFQVAALTLRINREVDVAEADAPTWFPPADLLNVLALLVTLVGVFASVAIDERYLPAARTSFGFAVVLLAGYPFALAGHYDMWNPRTGRSWKYCTVQEFVAVALTGGAAVAYLAVSSVPLWLTVLVGALAAVALSFGRVWATKTHDSKC